MDFSLSEEQQEVRDLARRILEDRCTPQRLEQVEASESTLDLELWRELARANLLGAGLPEAAGGSDLGFFTTCLLLEEIGRALAPVPALATLVMGALPIARFGNERRSAGAGSPTSSPATRS
jgi:alkylation response protein AidB-like acyl-CoA dehydrogenase